jgi:peptide/nickel transport system permease protein
VVVVAICAPLLAPYDPNAQNLLGRLKPPGTPSRSFMYLLGSDELGRDVLSRLIHGARVSLAVAFAAALISGTVGVALGMLAAYYRGAGPRPS